jgi:hypothetical protein
MGLTASAPHTASPDQAVGDLAILQRRPLKDRVQVPGAASEFGPSTFRTFCYMIASPCHCGSWAIDRQ